ncbi:unnamed protein product [Chilo suppressalis]|uniref:Carboxypeptidase n=1 Tax=Chilo suppressalis TaxID=168631 RepID=A0ABN8BAC9_CHISP|nr:unnamed protein product [Chilo suppressalis]
MFTTIGFLLVLQLLVNSECFVVRSPETKNRKWIEQHSKDPLILTPYVESGKIKEGQKLSRVPVTEKLGIKSYSGFFTVNKAHDSNQFFWYFPPINDDKKSPVLVWLQGGPGGSSLFGLFEENGPLIVKNETFERRQYTWALNHHLIYIDNPVGAGFSYTNNSSGFCTNQTQVGDELYSTVVQFLQLFPELQENKFFISGESYAGKYIPALAYKIHKTNPTAKIKINLSGIAIGNGYSDPEHQLSYGKYLYQLGLVDRIQSETLEENEIKTVQYIHEKLWQKATDAWNDMMSFFAIKAGSINLYNYLHTDEYTNSTWRILDNTDVRQSIHVGDLPYSGLSNEVYRYLRGDMMKSVAPEMSELLDYYSVLIYNGQLDIIVVYPLTVNYLSHLNFTAAEDYKKAERHQWMVGDELAG